MEVSQFTDVDIIQTTTIYILLCLLVKLFQFIDPLPPIYHSQIDYEAFERNFYVEHEDIASLNFYETAELRRKLGISVSGPDPCKPVSSFAHFGFDEKLMDAIRKSEYTQPTPIQAQGIPCALSGRDMIGIAKTGSGKTVTYLWPALVHIMHQVEDRAEGVCVVSEGTTWD